jgi:misacylated tRNA(Ala) deacylase
MTEELFRQDATLTECAATVLAVTEQGVVLGRTVFYPLGGGQAGDSGWLVLADGAELVIADTRKEKDEAGVATGRISHLPAPNSASSSQK